MVQLRSASSFFGAGLVWLAGAAAANDVHVAPVRRFVEANVRSWIADRVIVETLRDRNVTDAGLMQADIDIADAQWRAEYGHPTRPMIDAILGNALSRFLIEKQAAAGGAITEIFVTDARGLSVGESVATSDYWQGDEPGWRNSYLKGAGALFVDRIVKDESTQTVQSQASLTIVDPQTDQLIGAITIGINLDAL